MPIDVLLVGGPLGAGKTTLLREHVIPHYQAQDQTDGLKLIINEAAQGNREGWNLDGKRLDSSVDKDSLMMFGASCVCCDGLNSLVTALDQINPDVTKRIVIEPTGIANLNSIATLIAKDPEKFELSEVAYMLPVKGFSRAEKNDGIVAANGIVLSWIEGQSDEDIQAVADYARARNPDAALFRFNDQFSWDQVTVNKWDRERFVARLEQPKHSHGHDHKHHHARYSVVSEGINPYAGEDTIQQVVRDVASQVERVKGYVRLSREEILSFDGVRGSVAFNKEPASDAYENGEIVLINRGMPENISDAISPITSEANGAVLLKGSTKEEFVDAMNKYAGRRETLPDVDSRVPNTYEGWDMYVGVAEQLDFEHGDKTLIKPVAEEFFEFSADSLRQLADSKQEDENTVRAIQSMKALYYGATYAADTLSREACGFVANELAQSLIDFSEGDELRLITGSDPSGYASTMKELLQESRDQEWISEEVYNSAMSNLSGYSVFSKNNDT